MEYNSLANHLTTIFQDVVINGLTEETNNEVINAFTHILETKDSDIYSQSILYNLINLIKQQAHISIMLSFIIKELELRCLRMQCLCLDEEKSGKIQPCCKPQEKGVFLDAPSGYQHPTQITDPTLYPNEGETGIVRTIHETDTERYEYSYEIDHTGKVLRFVEEFVTPLNARGKNQEEIDLFNKSIIESLKNKYVKPSTEKTLEENDLQ